MNTQLKPSISRRRLLQGASSLVAAWSGVPAFGQSGGAIVLGQSAPLSGPAAALGADFKSGAELHFARVNERGGVNGRTIELRSLDDGYEPERCKANTEKLLKDGVFSLFGYIGTPTSMAALPLAIAARVPFIAPFTGAQGLREPFSRFVFHVRASYFDETARIVKQATDIGIKKVGVFYQNDSYGKAGLDGVTAALRALSLEPAGLGTVERNTVDVDAAVKSILAAQPDVIVQISAYKSCAAFIRAAKKSGFNGTFYNVSFVGTKALADELGHDAAGVVVSQVMPYPFAPISPLAGEYLSAGKAAQGDKFVPNYSSMEGYVAARALTEGLRHAGGRATPDGLVSGMELIRELNLGGFYLDFGPNKHMGSKFVDLTILTGDGKVRR